MYTEDEELIVIRYRCPVSGEAVISGSSEDRMAKELLHCDTCPHSGNECRWGRPEKDEILWVEGIFRPFSKDW
jgi:hypothetical protein